ncbi:MAG: hypothetical protein R3B49_10200 [Phycisphaerales bacterium]
MFQINPESIGEASVAAFVNPKNHDAIDRMFAMMALAQRGEPTAEEFAGLVDDHYIYLGWASRER